MGLISYTALPVCPTSVFFFFFVIACLPDDNVMAVAAGGAAVAGLGILLGALLSRR